MVSWGNRFSDSGVKSETPEPKPYQIYLNRFEDSNEFYNQFSEKKEINAWLNHWKRALKKEYKDLSNLSDKLNQINPVYIPRNHQVQVAIDLAYENDFSKMLEMIEVFKNPFEEVAKYESYSQAPLEDEKVRRTFCGTQKISLVFTNKKEGRNGPLSNL